MQFSVPQFTDVEDKIIGPLTLKQFLVLLATGGIILFFYSILKLSIFFFFFAIPVALVGLALAFGKFNGRPIMEYIGVFINYISRPQVRVFKREEVNVSMTFKAEKPKQETVISKQKTEENESRLRKLAYLLDQKAAEEKQIIEKKNG